jgi:DNA-binding transcriptional LysR family regulator
MEERGMELRQLETFVRVAESGSFTRAAETLNLTQPAVTRQIAALESELKTRLLDRMGRQVQLTASGEVLKRYADEIVRLAQEAGQAMADIEGGRSGRIAIGASSTLAAYVLPPLLRTFRRKHPQVEIAIHTGVSAQVVEMVRVNRVDVGLVTSDVEDLTLSETFLTEYATVAVLPGGHPLANRQEITAGELANTPLILMESGTNLRAYVDRRLSAAGVHEQITMELDNVEAIKRMVEAGLGISLLPEVSVQEEVADGRLSALKLAEAPQGARRIALIQRRDKYITTAIRAFVGLVKESFPPSLSPCAS